jgi:uncharacterized protein (DUF885 family)
MFRSILFFVLMSLFPVTHYAAELNETEQAFRTLYQTEWQWRLQQFPRLATSANVHDWDDRLERMDIATQEARRAHWADVRKQLLKLDTNQLSDTSKINLAVYQNQLDSLIGSIDTQAYLLVISSDTSFYSSLPRLWQGQALNNTQDYKNYLARLSAIPRYFEDHIELMSEGLRVGMTTPQVVMRDRDQELSSIADIKNAKATPFFEPLLKFPAEINQSERRHLLSQAEKIIENQVLPAYRHLFGFINKKYLPQARLTLGARYLPQGEAYYRQQIRAYTTLDLTPKQIHKIGRSEVARIRKDMLGLQRKAKFEGDFSAFLKFLRSDPQFYVQTPRLLLMHAAFISKKIDAQLPRYFYRLPRQPYGVAAVPDAIAPFYTAGRYVGAEDDASAGLFWVNTYKLESRPLYALPALALHEAVPGHHLQLALAAERDEQPAFRRHGYLSAYGEGWALYAEYLGQEMGIYETVYEDFGRLSYEMWRACRLVVDTGIHEMGWSREQAIEYLRVHTALSEHEINTEVDRYISWPAQALSYKLGELKIRELRARAEKKLGARFDIRAFHDAVLATGSVPLTTLEKEIDDWIAAFTLPQPESK